MGECQQKWQKKGPPKIFPSLRAMKKLSKNFRINFFRTLEINQRLVVTQELFIQEKWLNLGMNSELCGILSCHSPPLPHSPAM